MSAVEVLQNARGPSKPEVPVQFRATAFNLSAFHVESVDRAVAMDMVVREHYLHRATTYQYSFGLYLGDVVGGVIIYGIPSSATLRSGICGPEEFSHVIEITRLWVADWVPKNGESLLIGASLRLLKAHGSEFDIVVSFADTAAGHLGKVYQATNFLYTGTNAHFRDPVPKGFVGHRLTAGKTSELKKWYRDTKGREPTGLSTFGLMEAKYGEGNVEWVDRSVKHRYVIFNSNKRRERELRKLLRYKVLPYPKEARSSDDFSPAQIVDINAGSSNKVGSSSTEVGLEGREAPTKAPPSRSEAQMEGRE